VPVSSRMWRFRPTRLELDRNPLRPIRRRKRPSESNTNICLSHHTSFGKGSIRAPRRDRDLVAPKG